MKMTSLKEKKIYVLTRDNYIYEYKDVKEAVFRFNQEMELLKNLDFSMYVIIKEKLDEIFGDWEDE